MPFCPNCGSEIPKGGQFCRACGAPASQHVQPAGSAGGAQRGARSLPLGVGFVGGHAIALIGSVLLLVGPFLAWRTYPSMSSIEGVYTLEFEAILLAILGGAGFISSAVALILRRRGLTIAPLVAGVIGLAVSIWSYVGLLDMVAESREQWGTAVGYGMHLCPIGAVLIIAGAILAFVSRKTDTGQQPKPLQTRATPQAAPEAPAAEQADPLALLQKLKEAKDAGLLTEEEYEQKRGKLVDSL